MKTIMVSVMLFSPWTKIEPEGLVRLIDRHSDIVQVPSLPPDPELGEQPDGEHHQGGLRNCLCNTGPEEYQSLFNIFVSKISPAAMAKRKGCKIDF